MRREPFDSSDPSELLADRFRKEVAEMAGQIFKERQFRGLSSIEHVQAFMAGVSAGLVGVCFAHIQNAGRDAMMEAIIEYLPQAREQAEEIFEDAALNS